MTTIPNYLIFAGPDYGSSEGMRDLYGTANTLEDALVIAMEAIEVGTKIGCRWWKHGTQPMEAPPDFEPYPCDWMQIVDLKTMKIVVESSPDRQTIIHY